jgi:hypothetical protein
MRLPVNGQWKVDHSSDRGLGIYATKNVHFDDFGRATLSNRTLSVFDSADDSDFAGAIAAYSNPDLVKIIGTGNNPYTVNLTSLPYTFTDDTSTNYPTGASNSGAGIFASKWRVSENSDMKSYDGSAWSDESLSPSLTAAKNHPICVHKGNNSIMVGNGASVEQYDTSLANTVRLTIPNTGSVQVVGIAYNRSLAAVITWDSHTQEAWMYIWDGATAAANYAYPLGSCRAYWVVPFEDPFAMLTGTGELLAWASTGLEPLDALPVFYSSAELATIGTRNDIVHETGAIVDRKRILFNIASYVGAKGSEPSRYNPLMPGGTWCFDKNVGLYHRHAPTSAKLRQTTFSNPGPNDNAGIVPADVSTNHYPDDGTPFLLMSTDTKAPTPLALNTLYYSYYDGSVMQACATRADALAGNFIPITDTDPSGAAYKLLFFPESDFGQLSSASGYAQVLTRTGPPQTNAVYTAFSLFQRYALAFKGLDTRSLGSDVNVFNIVMDRGENRGWILTQKMYAANVTDAFQKLFVKARHLFTDLDQVIVKYRNEDPDTFPIYAIGGTDYATWVTETRFTTTADLSAAKTAFDAGAAYEIEFTAGAGAGYLAHIAAISLSSGTYTVDIDETIRNISTGDTAYFVVNNFIKMQTKDAAEQIDSDSNTDYSEFPIGVNGKWIQFRFELRGHLVSIEDYELLTTGHKSAL